MKIKFESKLESTDWKKRVLLVDRVCSHLPERHVLLQAKPNLALPFLIP